MCGIIGYVSAENQPHGVLIEGLKALEYRGYDSCGLAIVKDQQLSLIKAKGKIINLENKCEKNLCGTLGIAHTRWATHGEPSEVNAHPHQLQQITLVHNGIIENSDELRRQFIEQGIEFKTATDTEVACAVLADCLKKNKNKISAIQRAKEQLRGSYAFAIVFADELDTVYAIRKDSPLILGTAEHKQFLASDISAFLKETRQIIELREDEIAILKAEDITFVNENKESYTKPSILSEMSLDAIQKEGYDTFLLKEIHEEPVIIKKTIRHYMTQGLDDLMETMPDLSCYKRFIFVGCGSAMYAGMIAKWLMERKARTLSSMEIASEFRYSEPILDERTCVVLISQSGETADTLAALRMCKAQGIKTIAIVNVQGSSIAKEADVFLPTLAGKEISVATTKAYCAQVAVLSLLCLKKMMQKNQLSLQQKKELDHEIQQLPRLLKQYMDHTSVESFARQLALHDHAFFIGRGMDYALSLEGALKLKEISYIHAEAYAAGEMKHGTISLIEERTPVIACITEPHLLEKTLSNMKEVKARGACVLLVIREDLIKSHIEADEIILLPQVDSLMQAIITVVPYQLLAYHVARLRGCNIDQPRNLAKSVTVE